MNESVYLKFCLILKALKLQERLRRVIIHHLLGSLSSLQMCRVMTTHYGVFVARSLQYCVDVGIEHLNGRNNKRYADCMLYIQTTDSNRIESNRQNSPGTDVLWTNLCQICFCIIASHPLNEIIVLMALMIRQVLFNGQLTLIFFCKRAQSIPVDRVRYSRKSITCWDDLR
jgi:hypothetical protein